MIELLNVRRVLLSAVVIAFVTSLLFVGTQAFFSDTEESTGNTFTAGALDLRVDSEAHFNGLVCRLNTQDDEDDGFGSMGDYGWHADGDPFSDDADVPAQHYPQPGDECGGTWDESDLIADAIEFRFFNFDDLKPGDGGENTISLHVYDNDAWGCFLVDNVEDDDNDCTEPETESSDSECSVEDPGTDLDGNGLGELGASLTFDGWLDQGTTPGFQCNHEGASPEVGPCSADPEEGDNIFQESTEGPLFWDDETVDEASEGPFAIRDVLGAAYSIYSCTEATGDTAYGECHGLAEDGRMVGSTTYYFGLAWNLPDSVGNEAQTDSLVADMIFSAEQHRNNGDFQCPTPDPDPIT